MNLSFEIRHYFSFDVVKFKNVRCLRNLKNCKSNNYKIESSLSTVDICKITPASRTRTYLLHNINCKNIEIVLVIRLTLQIPHSQDIFFYLSENTNRKGLFARFSNKDILISHLLFLDLLTKSHYETIKILL